MLKSKQYLISHTSSGTLAGPGAKLRTLLEGILKICKSVCVVLQEVHYIYLRRLLKRKREGEPVGLVNLMQQ